MDFNHTQEQQQFADALRRWAAKDYAFEARKKIIHSEAGVSSQAWATLAELGMLALPVPEEQGGFDGGATDMLVVMQELGRALVVEPYFATVLGAHALKLGGRHAYALEQVAAGELKLACAFGEAHARYDLMDVRSSATPEGNGYRLNGRKSFVLHGAQAQMLVVSALLNGAVHLFAVPADAAQCTDCRTIDGMRSAEVKFDNVLLGADALIGGADLLEACADYGAGLLCFEALGAMDAIFHATLEYLKTRSQFGAPIGKFQALQHRMADMYIHLEQARSMAMLAAVKLDGADPAERRRVVSAAKYRINQASRFVGQQAVQLHGGMGVTDELPAAHHFKRLAMIELSFGDADHHLSRFVRESAYA